MAKNANNFFKGKEKKDVMKTLKEASKDTSVEIIPVIATRSSGYDYANFIIGFIFTLFAFTFSWFFFHSLPIDDNGWAVTHTLNIGLMGILLIQIIAFIIGSYIGVLFPSLRLLFVSKVEMEKQVCRRAKEAFSQFQEKFDKNKASVVIFISLFERIVRVQGNNITSEKLKQNEWESISEIILANFRKKKFADGLQNGIVECGRILKEYFPKTKANTIDSNLQQMNGLYILDN